MTRICAWCKTELDSGSASTDFTTHGICDSCADRFVDSATPSREFLDELDVPVLLLGEDRRVIIANKQACTALNRPLGQIEGFLGGEIVVCEYANHPESCGRSIHCAGCTILHSVTRTKETGERLDRVPATIRRSSKDGAESVRYLISTRRVKAGVLLVVEDAPRQDA